MLLNIHPELDPIYCPLHFAPRAWNSATTTFLGMYIMIHCDMRLDSTISFKPLILLREKAERNVVVSSVVK